MLPPTESEQVAHATVPRSLTRWVRMAVNEVLGEAPHGSERIAAPHAEDVAATPPPENAAHTQPPLKVVTIADAGEATDLAGRIVLEARARGVDVAVGGSSNAGSPRVNLAVQHRWPFIDVLAQMCSQDGDIRLFVKGDHITSIEDLRERQRTDPVDIGIVRHVSADNSEMFVSRIEIAYWREVERFGALRVVPNRSGSKLSRIADVRQLAELQDLDRPRDGHRDPQTHDFPIDVVYTWVDGNDPVWATQKDEHAGRAGRPADAVSRAMLKERFQNRDELKYSLRSIAMFAPFVRDVYIVTADQKPDWLNTDNSRVKLVSHKDIYANAGALPTFNSSSIETQLHHIEGLSEHFIYFNDDMFVGQMSAASDFFAPNGIAKYYPSNNRFSPEYSPENLEEYAQADVNAVILFREKFGLSPTCLMQHAPYAARRSCLFDLERAFQQAFDACAVERFRSASDLRPIAFMHPHFAAYRGLAVPADASEGYFALWYDDIETRLARVLERRNHKFFCLNDVGVAGERQPMVDGIVSRFLEAYFPVRSEFEL